MKSYRDRVVRRFQLGFTNLTEFIFYYFSGGGKLSSLMCCLSQLYALHNRLFLLDRPFSNSQVNKRIQCNVKSTRSVVVHVFWKGGQLLNFLVQQSYRIISFVHNQEYNVSLVYKSSEQVCMCVKVLYVAKEQNP